MERIAHFSGPHNNRWPVWEECQLGQVKAGDFIRLDEAHEYYCSTEHRLLLLQFGGDQGTNDAAGIVGMIIGLRKGAK